MTHPKPRGCTPWVNNPYHATDPGNAIPGLRPENHRLIINRRLAMRPA